MTLVNTVGTPQTLAASSLPPTARRYSPSGVFRSTTQATKLATPTIITGMGKTPTLEASAARKAGARPKTGCPPVKIKAAALNKLKVPSVTIKGCKLPSVIISPFIAPQAAPRTKPSSTARTGCKPAAIAEAETTAENAATDPTERSMPPEMITSVMPTAIQALIDDC